MKALRTRNEAQVRKDFVWGEIKALHRVGADYLIVEYKPNRPSNVPAKGWKAGRSFHPFIKGREERTGEVIFRDSGHSYGSMDACLIACVVYRHEWKNHGIGAAMNERLTGYVCRTLNIRPRED